ncbi:MAG TPA: hypothetical protein PKO38_08355 [Bacillota bacterium]|nr:hypothetical protein [Bacillota bacterium]HOB87685.1 hypothetical protein [Bacillota bacterium]HOP68394.1 hypothetical protein [Bacillota bacterium]HPT34774.1 hypothetical protein [Bacillota bacterium]HPZ64929.1 hypothetical protein [Bacillota bacterium]
MDKEKVKEMIRNEAKDNRLSCRSAFAIAEAAGCSTALVGELCNELKVKIVGCQLGCF